MNIYLLTLWLLIGFFVARFDSGKMEGKDGSLKSLKFNIKRYRGHIHHWFIASIILIIFLSLGFYNDLAYGLLIGLIIQGLTYKDFYKIIYLRR